MAAIFDMDGLLFDTDPVLWAESMHEVAEAHQVNITPDLFKYTRGLRIYEVTDFWAQKLGWQSPISAKAMAEEIVDNIIQRTISKGAIMPGVLQCLELFLQHGIVMGVATSSPKRMSDALVQHFGLGKYFKTITSADTCAAGKPHPEVYLQCAAALGVQPWQCVTFEDSINGMIAAKAARMISVVVPEPQQKTSPKFGLADMVLDSLSDFTFENYQKLLQ